MAFNINQRLNGLDPLAYSGVNPVQPPDFVTKPRPPTANDSKNILLGTIWLDTTGYPMTAPTNQNIWMLVALIGNQATWVNLAASSLTLTGDSGGAVSPTAGNINILGSGLITVVGSPGTSTLTITPSGAIASSFLTDSGTATPALGVITFNAVSQAGSSVTFSGSTSIVRLNTTDASGNTHIGNGSGNSTLTSTNSTLLGKNTGNALTSGANNTVIGSLSGALITSGSNNTVIGEGSGTALLTGSSNIIIGKSAGNNLTGAEGTNLLIGFGGLTGTSGLVSIGIPGDTVPYVHNWGGGNSFFGRAGNLTLIPGSATNNVGLGNTALAALTTGPQNAAFGNASLQSLTTGTSNTAVGAASMQLATTSGQNTAVGNGSISKVTAGANQNSAIGYQSLFNLLTGSGNTTIGISSGNNYTGAESNNICLGSLGVLGESNVMRLGLTGTTTKSFIVGVRGTTTVNADAIAVLIDSAGQLGTVSSSARYKDNIEPMASYSHVLMHLRPVVFNYKNHSPEAKSVGLIAEEVAAVAPQLAVYDADGLPETVKYHDLVPMLLNELQKMHKVLANSNLLIDELAQRVQILESK